MEEKKEVWLNYLALSTVVFAVCATLATFKGGGYSTQSIMSQSKASDNWGYFQSKTIKEDLYKLQVEKLEMDQIGKNQKYTELYQDKIKDYKFKIDKYEKEKNNIESQAKNLEYARDQAQLHAKSFGKAVIFLQIAILLSTISGLLKKKYIWYIGIGSGLIGIGYFVNGFVLLS